MTNGGFSGIKDAALGGCFVNSSALADGAALSTLDGVFPTLVTLLPTFAEGLATPTLTNPPADFKETDFGGFPLISGPLGKASASTTWDRSGVANAQLRAKLGSVMS